MEWWSHRPEPMLHYSTTQLLRSLDFHLCENFERVLLENFEFIFRAQKFQRVDHRDEIVRRLSRFRAHGSSGSRRFRSKKHLIDAALLDRRSQKIHVIS